MTELKRSSRVYQLLQSGTPNGRVGCKEVIIPQIDIGAHQSALIITFFIKEPFKVGIREDYRAGRSVGIEIGKAEVMKEMPRWKKVGPDTGQTTLYRDGDDARLERFGYQIDLKELDKLPREE